MALGAVRSYSQSTLTPRERGISLIEFVFGAFIVIGQNVFHILPNEVPILFVLFWISLRIRYGGWHAKGLEKPKSWAKTALLAVLAAAVLQLGSELVVEPWATQFFHRPEHVSSLLRTPALDWKLALRNLAIVWVFAAFGEEIGYRGYLLTCAADFGNRSRLAYVVAMVLIAVLFGFAHFYKGPAGVVDSSYSGLILGGAYLLSGRNLWCPNPGARVERYVRCTCAFPGVGKLNAYCFDAKLRISNLPIFSLSRLTQPPRES